MQNSVDFNDFIDHDYVNFASYDNIRKIASYIDGQKNSMRKILFVALQRENKFETCDILSSSIKAKSCYIHGSLDGVLVNMCQAFTGSNNVPYFQRDGFFGTKLTPQATAMRYISAAREKYLDKIFIPEYNEVLVNQVFEGHQVEPAFYVPIIPMLLLNGSAGLSVGFAQKIFPRKLSNILEYILEGKEYKDSIFYRGYTGRIENNLEKVKFIGNYKMVKDNRLEITELPISFNRDKYVAHLEKLKDKKIIKWYTDSSETDTDKYNFLIWLNPDSIADENLVGKLGLVENESENYTCLDKNNRVVVFKSAKELLDAYCEVKKEYTEKWKNWKLSSLDSTVKDLQNKYRFLKLKIDLKRNINDLKSELENKKFEKIDSLLSMPINHYTTEKQNEIANTIEKLEKEIKILGARKIMSIWKNEIEDLVKVIGDLV